MTNYIWITFEQDGTHSWPDADKEVRYLHHKHWHVFKFKVFIEVLHNDREIEFHKFRNYVYRGFVKRWPKNLRNKSCEMMADRVYEHIEKKYPDRKVIIEISEDSINGVIMKYPKPTSLNSG